MLAHQWINNPTSGSISVTSAKQETSSDGLGTRTKVSGPLVSLSALCLLLLVTCVTLSVLYNNESDSRPGWKNLRSDYQNLSDGFLALTSANNLLRRDKELLEEQKARLLEENKLLNGTAAHLKSVNLALSLESSELREQIVNLTSTNVRLTREHERLVESTSEQEGEKMNMSRTIRLLVEADARRREDGRRLAQVSDLLRDELDQVKEENRQLLEINDKFQLEVKNLSEKVGALWSDEREQRLTELREQNQNLSSVLMKERQEAAEREASRRAQMEEVRSVKEAFGSLDRYCPVVQNNTRERLCRKCDASWRLFEMKCYYFSSRLLTWSSSRGWCQSHGGDLLVINSAPEQRFVFESSRALEASSGRALEASSGRLWIGLTDTEEEGEWSWVDGSPVASGQQFWLSRAGLETEPDDWKLDDPLGEDCGHIDTGEELLTSWMDGSCKTPYRWICEKDV